MLGYPFLSDSPEPRLRVDPIPMARVESQQKVG